MSAAANKSKSQPGEQRANPLILVYLGVGVLIVGWLVVSASLNTAQVSSTPVSREYAQRRRRAPEQLSRASGHAQLPGRRGARPAAPKCPPSNRPVSTTAIRGWSCWRSTMASALPKSPVRASVRAAIPGRAGCRSAFAGCVRHHRLSDQSVHRARWQHVCHPCGRLVARTVHRLHRDRCSASRSDITPTQRAHHFYTSLLYRTGDSNDGARRTVNEGKTISDHFALVLVIVMVLRVSAPYTAQDPGSGSGGGRGPGWSERRGRNQTGTQDERT